MLPSIEMIIENVDEETPLVIIKLFETNVAVVGSNFFKALGNINLEKF